MSEWAAYREEAFGEPYMVWHDGPDFVEFQARFAADPELATRLLAAGLAEGDAVAAQTPRELSLSPEQRAGFVRLLTEALPTANANTLLHWAGRRTEVSEDRELFALVADDGGPEGWAQAAERLAAAVQA